MFDARLKEYLWRTTCPQSTTLEQQQRNPAVHLLPGGAAALSSPAPPSENNLLSASLTGGVLDCDTATASIFLIRVDSNATSSPAYFIRAQLAQNDS